MPRIKTESSQEGLVVSADVKNIDNMLLGGSSDALSTLRKTKQLTNQVEILTGLLPLCAWCKKVRSESGYWEQIDKYITTNSKTALTHGVCPDCKSNFLSGLTSKV